MAEHNKPIGLSGRWRGETPYINGVKRGVGPHVEVRQFTVWEPQDLSNEQVFALAGVIDPDPNKQLIVQHIQPVLYERTTVYNNAGAPIRSDEAYRIGPVDINPADLTPRITVQRFPVDLNNLGISPQVEIKAPVPEPLDINFPKFPDLNNS